MKGSAKGGHILRSRSEDTWFSREIEAMAPTIFRIAFAILRNRADSEDAAQNAVLKAYTNLDTLKDRRYFKTWLIRILKNECVNALHARKPVADLDSCVSVGYEMQVPDMDLNRAFDALNEDERLAITLFYYEGYSTKEIAKICEENDGTIRTRLSRARRVLRDKLSEQEAES